MNKQGNGGLDASKIQQGKAKAGLSGPPRTAERRRDALYGAKEGPLLAWLFEEARAQGLQMSKLAEKLGVTYGYVAQLRVGFRKIENISDRFARACACFLGVPTVIVKLLAGRITLDDFDVPGNATERRRRQGMQAMRRDPVLGPLLPANLDDVGYEMQDAMLALYQESTGHEIYRARQLPEIVSYLQKAALIHCENIGRVSPEVDIGDVEDNDAAAA